MTFCLQLLPVCFVFFLRQNSRPANSVHGEIAQYPDFNICNLTIKPNTFTFFANSLTIFVNTHVIMILIFDYSQTRCNCWLVIRSLSNETKQRQKIKKQLLAKSQEDENRR